MAEEEAKLSMLNLKNGQRLKCSIDNCSGFIATSVM